MDNNEIFTKLEKHDSRNQELGERVAKLEANIEEIAGKIKQRIQRRWSVFHTIITAIIGMLCMVIGTIVSHVLFLHS